MKLIITLLVVFSLLICLGSGQRSLKQKLEEDGEIKVLIQNNSIDKLRGRNYHKGKYVNLNDFKPGYTVRGSEEATPVYITKKSDYFGGYTIKTDQYLWVPLRYSGYRSSVAELEDENDGNSRWSVKFVGENSIKLGLGPMKYIRYKRYRWVNSFYIEKRQLGNLYARRFGFYWTYKRKGKGAEVFQLTEVLPPRPPTPPAPTPPPSPPAEKTLEQLVQEGPVVVKIRLDALAAHVGKGWHSGIHINISGTRIGGDQYGRPQEEELTITKMIDEHGGYTIKSATKLWVPYSSSGFRTTVALVEDEGKANTRWNIIFLDNNQISLELGPKRIMRQNYPSVIENYVAPDYIGRIYGKYSGIFWNYESNKGAAQIFQTVIVPQQEEDNNNNTDSSDSTGGDSSDSTGGDSSGDSTGDSTGDNSGGDSTGDSGSGSGSESSLEQRLNQGPVDVYIKNEAIQSSVGSGWHTGIHINLSDTRYESDQMGKSTKQRLTITKMNDDHGGYTIKGGDKLWVPFSSSGFRTSVAPASDESKANTRWTIVFLPGNELSLKLGPKRIMKQTYPSANDNYLAPDYIGSVYGKYSGFFWNYDSDKGSAQRFQYEIIP